MTDETTGPAIAAMAARLDARLKDALAGIPSVRDVQVRSNHYGDVFRLMTAFKGWSPSLHGVSIQQTREYHDDPVNHAAIEEQETDRIAQMARLQAERAADARRLERREPFSRGQIGHLSIDAALPSIVGRDDVRLWLVEAVRRAYGSTMHHAGGHKFESGGVLIGDQRQDDGTWIRLLAPHLKLRSDDGRRHATLRGFDLDVEADHLPDTMLSALEGRELGNLVRLHPILDGRIISQIRNRTHKSRPGIIVTIALDVDPIDVVLARAA